MIYQVITKKPFINLGGNRQSIKVGIDDVVNIWQTEIYNAEAYVPTLISSGANIILEGLERSIVSFPEVGTFTVQFNSFRSDRKLNLLSNIIEIEVFANADSNKITADTTLITADYHG